MKLRPGGSCTLILIAMACVVIGCQRTSEKSGANPEQKDHSEHKVNGQKKDSSHADHRHGQGKAMLMVQTDPEAVSAGKPATLQLMIHGSEGKMIKDFALVHEQKVHLIIIRDGLDQFAHIHPAIDKAGNMTVTHTFPTGGTYRLYADYQPIGGTPDTATAEVKVAGEVPPIPALKPNVPGKVKGEGLDAAVTINPAKMGDGTMIHFEITDTAGKPAMDLEPYMGAMGHLVVVSQDGKRYIHAHPADEKQRDTNLVAFMAHFPQAGLYKGWGQFKRHGEVHVIPFILQVEK